MADRLLFRLTMYDDKRLLLTFEPSLAPDEFRDLHERVLEFPQRRYNRTFQAWFINIADANFEYLFSQFDETEYALDPDARLVSAFHKKTWEVQNRREQRRWRFVFDGIVPPLDGYVPYTDPYKHQQVCLDAVHGSEYFGGLMETGTGKTWVAINEARWCAEERVAAGQSALKVLVVCPKTIRGTWLTELKKHLPPTYKYWARRIRGGMRFVESLLDGVRAQVPLKFWIASYDSLPQQLEVFAKMHFHLCVLDESTHIKNTNAKRTKAAFELAESCERRLILTGTPVANNILDLWAQFHFLRPGQLGYDSYRAFRNHFADVRKTHAGFDKVWGFRSLEELKRRMAKCSFVVRKQDCLDLPPKSYSTRSVEMSPKQRSLYDDMLFTFVASLDENFTPDGTARAQIILTKLLRLAQICSGFIQPEEGPPVAINGPCPKLEALEELLDTFEPHSRFIIWARFRYDIAQIQKLLARKQITYRTITGADSEKERDTTVHLFASDVSNVRAIVGNQQAGGMGLTLVGSSKEPVLNAIYYNNNFSLLQRVQSEDRCHRIGTQHPVTYHDIVCENSIDEYTVELLQGKREISEMMKDMSTLKAILLGKGSAE